MPEKYRVGVIGRTGKGDYGHGIDRVWLDVPRAEVVAVADEHAGGRADAARRLSAPAAYADYREMLDKEKLDIVALGARWIDQHHEIIVAALEHGCHVYTEKPLCRTLEEADDMVRAAEMRHLKVAVAHTNRYSPVLPVVQKLVEDGEIGRVLEIRARGKEDARGGAEDLWVLGTHMLDLMRSFAGDIQSCFAQVTVEGRPVTKADVYEGNEGIGPLAGDGVEATYRFKNGVTGHFSSHKNQGGQPSRFGLKIFGSKGVIEMVSGYRRSAYLLRDSSWSPAQTGSMWVPVSSQGIGKQETNDTGSHGGNLDAVVDLFDAIENDRQPKSNLYDARSAIEMIVGVFESHRQGRPVSFPLENRKNPLTMLG